MPRYSLLSWTRKYWHFAWTLTVKTAADSFSGDWPLQLYSAPWPGRCSPTQGSAGASTTSTPPSPSSASSSPPIHRRRSWARTRSCVWPCATSTSWCSCWRVRTANRPATPRPLCSPFSEETWNDCTPLHTPGPWPATQKSPHLDPAATALRPGRNTAAKCKISGLLWTLLLVLKTDYPSSRFISLCVSHKCVTPVSEQKLQYLCGTCRPWTWLIVWMQPPRWSVLNYDLSF